MNMKKSEASLSKCSPEQTAKQCNNSAIAQITTTTAAASSSSITAVSAQPQKKRIINKIPIDFNKLRQAGLDRKIAEALSKQKLASGASKLTLSTNSKSPKESSSAAATTSTTIKATQQQVKQCVDSSAANPTPSKNSKVMTYIQKIVPPEITITRPLPTSSEIKAMVRGKILKKINSNSAEATSNLPAAFNLPIPKADLAICRPSTSKEPPVVLNFVNPILKTKLTLPRKLLKISPRPLKPKPPGSGNGTMPVEISPNASLPSRTQLDHENATQSLIVLENKVLAPNEKIDLRELQLGNVAPSVERTNKSVMKLETNKKILNAAKLQVSREMLSAMAKEIRVKLTENAASVESPPDAADVPPILSAQQLSSSINEPSSNSSPLEASEEPSILIPQFSSNKEGDSSLLPQAAEELPVLIPQQLSSSIIMPTSSSSLEAIEEASILSPQQSSSPIKEPSLCLPQETVEEPSNLIPQLSSTINEPSSSSSNELKSSMENSPVKALSAVDFIENSPVKELSAVDFIAQLAAANPMDEFTPMELSPEELNLSATFARKDPSTKKPVSSKDLSIGNIIKLEDLNIMHATLDIASDKTNVLCISPKEPSESTTNHKNDIKVTTTTKETEFKVDNKMESESIRDTTLTIVPPVEDGKQNAIPSASQVVTKRLPMRMKSKVNLVQRKKPSVINSKTTVPLPVEVTNKVGQPTECEESKGRVENIEDVITTASVDSMNSVGKETDTITSNSINNSEPTDVAIANQPENEEPKADVAEESTMVVKDSIISEDISQAKDVVLNERKREISTSPKKHDNINNNINDNCINESLAPNAIESTTVDLQSTEEKMGEDQIPIDCDHLISEKDDTEISSNINELENIGESPVVVQSTSPEHKTIKRKQEKAWKKKRFRVATWSSDEDSSDFRGFYDGLEDSRRSRQLYGTDISDDATPDYDEDDEQQQQQIKRPKVQETITSVGDEAQCEDTMQNEIILDDVINDVTITEISPNSSNAKDELTDITLLDKDEVIAEEKPLKIRKRQSRMKLLSQSTDDDQLATTKEEQKIPKNESVTTIDSIKKRGRKPRAKMLSESSNDELKPLPILNGQTTSSVMEKNIRLSRNEQLSDLNDGNIDDNDNENPMTSAQSTVVELPKKRGRKSKADMRSESCALEDAATTSITICAEATPSSVQKRRGRPGKSSSQKIKSETENETETSIVIKPTESLVASPVEATVDSRKRKFPFDSTPVPKKRGPKPKNSLIGVNQQQQPQQATSTPTTRKRGPKPKIKTESIDETLNTPTIPTQRRGVGRPSTKTKKCETEIESNGNLPNDNVESEMQSSSKSNRGRPKFKTIKSEIFLPSVPNRRIKTNNQSAESDVQPHVSDFNERLLLARSREQVDSTEELRPGAIDSGHDGGDYQCGLCLIRCTTETWLDHLGEHYGVGWLANNPPPSLGRSAVLAMMISYVKHVENKPLICRLCSRSYNSALGMLMHLESCGIEQKRVECKYCNRQYILTNIQKHEQICTVRYSENDKKTEEVEAKVESECDAVFSNAGRAKRKSTLKAEKQLKRIGAHLQGNGDLEKSKKKMEKNNGDSSDYDAQGDSESSNEYNSDGADSAEENARSGGINESDGESDVETSRHRPSKSSKNNSSLASNSSSLFTRQADIDKYVANKWKAFEQLNYSKHMLYEDLLPSYTVLSPERSKEILPDMAKTSVRFAYNSNANEKTEQWMQLSTLQTQNLPNEHFCYLGAPIKVLAWAPLPSKVKSQFLLCSMRADELKYSRYKKTKHDHGLLLLLRCTANPEAKRWELQTKLHYAIHLPHNSVHCLAFMPSGGYDENTNRLGLLAVGTASSDIHIYALPIEVASSGGETIIELKSLLVLSLDTTTTTMQDHCMQLCWSESAGHGFIAGGYFSGTVAYWDISDNQSINCITKEEEKMHFIPLNAFYAGDRNVCHLELHYDCNGPRWLAVATAMRTLLIYDIENLSQPLLLRDEVPNRSFLSAMYWPPIWESLVLGCGDVYKKAFPRILTFNTIGIAFSSNTMDYAVNSVRSLHYGFGQNVLAVTTDSGDVALINPRELNMESTLRRQKSTARLVSTMNVHNISKDKKPNDIVQLEDFTPHYGLAYKPLAVVETNDKVKYLSNNRKQRVDMRRFIRNNCVRFNWNAPARQWVAVGGEPGLLRIFQFKREKLFI